MQATPAQTAHSASSPSAADDDVKLVAVPPAYLERIWPQVQGMFLHYLRTADDGRTMSDLVNPILAEEHQLWMVWRNKPVAIGATRLGVRPDGRKVCTIEWCAGEGVKDFMPLLNPIEAWAKSEGCTQMDGYFRKGWARHLPDYKITRVVMTKDI